MTTTLQKVLYAEVNVVFKDNSAKQWKDSEDVTVTSESFDDAAESIERADSGTEEASAENNDQSGGRLPIYSES